MGVQRQVLGPNPQDQGREAVRGRLLAVDREVRLGAEHALQTLGQAGSAQVHATARGPALRRPGALSLERRRAAGPRDDIEGRAIGLSVRLGLQIEWTIGGQAQGAGDRSAVGLLSVRLQMQRIAAAQIEVEIQVIAGVQARRHRQLPLLPTQPRHVIGAGDIEIACLTAELRSREQAEGEGVEVDRERRGAGLARRAHDGAPQDRDVARGDLFGVEPTAEQLGRSPGHAQIVRLQPDASGIGDSQAPDAEVLPDIPRQAFDAQDADTPQFQTRDAGLQEHPALRRDRGVAKTAGHDDQNAREDGRNNEGDPAPAQLLHRGLSDLGRGLARRLGGVNDRVRQIGLVVFPAQKLCPMLR